MQYIVMSWLALTSDHVKARLGANELETIEEVGGGDGDRLAGIITQVTALVRARVAGCHRNELGTAGMIPDECLHAAATIAKHDIRATLPSTGSEDEGDLRKDEYREAMDFLKAVSRCDVAITSDSGSVNGAGTGVYGGSDLLTF